jgi:hypothetical protein
MRHRDHRYSASADLRLIYQGQVRFAELRNISVSGAQFRSADVLPEGASVHLCYANMRIPAQVVRSNGAETAIKFSVRLRVSHIEDLRESFGRASDLWDSRDNASYREL